MKAKTIITVSWIVGIALPMMLIVLLFLSVKDCSNEVKERGGISGVISDMVIGAEEFKDDVKEKVEEKRKAREGDSHVETD
jgi:hypothetical protein